MTDRRLPVRISATVRLAGVAEPASISDIGTGGLLLAAADQGDRARFAIGQALELVCHLPRTVGPVRLTATVAWSTLGPDHKGREAVRVGVQFANLTESARAVVDNFVIGFFETVMLVDADDVARAHMRSTLSSNYDVIEAATAEQALELLETHEPAVLLAAESLPDTDAKQLFRDVQTAFPSCKAVRMVTTSSEGAALDDLSRLYRVFYFLRRPVEQSELTAVVRSAVSRYWELSRRDPHTVVSARNAAFTRNVLEASRRMGNQRDLEAAGRLAVDTVIDLIDCDRGYCYIYDPISEALWAAGSGPGNGTRSAIAGLSGYVARTATAVCLPVAERDPRFQRAIDDPEASGGERFMAEPILSTDRRALGVLLAIRNSARPVFTGKETQQLAVLATHFAPAFGQMALQTQIERIFAERTSSDMTMFRQNAIDAYRTAGTTLTRPLALSPRWLGHSYRLLVAASLALILFLVFGTMSEYADGPAIVRIEGRLDLTANDPGIVSSVPVQPGQRVTKGAVLVTLNASKEQFELDKIQHEFELQLVKSLREPGDTSVRENLARLRTERDLASSRLDAKTLRAPHDGIINDVRVRAGNSIAAGDPMLSITGDRAEPVMTAILPGQYRPLLRLGQAVRLEVSGFRYAYAQLNIEAIGDEVVGPEEVKRYLGKEVADTVTLHGPVVLARARMRDRTFVSEGKTYNFHDGMQANAEVRIRTQRLIVRLIPALQKVHWLGISDVGIVGESVMKR